MEIDRANLLIVKIKKTIDELENNKITSIGLMHDNQENYNNGIDTAIRIVKKLLR
ncbi:MAG: hypothetical protein WC755_07680 [Candidatus Woesearchaeota archaeon]|jgi:hypothetical protein